jgi:nucleoside-diphosphate-sugar epimerase
MTKIAVLGAGGFVGSRLFEQAAVRPDVEAIPVLRSPKSVARLSKLGLTCRYADTSKRAALAEALKGNPVVVNLAAGEWTRIASDAQLAFEAARDAGVGLFIHLSSAVVFGRVESNEIQDDSPPDLSHWMLYAQEKGKAENFLRSQLGFGGTKLVVLRPGLIWGPRSPWSIMPAKQLSSGTAWLAGEGKGVCNLVHVDNLLRYIWKAIESPPPQGGFFNVSDPGTLTWQTFYTAVAQGLGYPLDRIRPTSAAAVQFSPGALMDTLKQQPVFYRQMKKVLNTLSGESKSFLKFYLPALAGGALRPSHPLDVPVTAGEPRLTREHWSLQNTVHRLPTDKFVRECGDPKLMTFEESLASTLAWLKFAGYAA